MIVRTPRTTPYDRRLEQYRVRYRKLQAQIAELGFISSGTVVQRHTTCGREGCRCQAEPPQRHGPYYQWTRKLAGKTVTRRLSERESQLYSEWIANSRRLHALVADMEELSARAAELILTQSAQD